MATQVTQMTSTIRSALWSKAMLPFLKWNLSTETTYILDPLSVVIVLASNAYKPIGTKLSISNGKICLHDCSMLQSTVRTIYGDTKTNVKLLHYPIIYACKHFMRKPRSADITYLFTKAIKGLENLKHTYHEERETRAAINTYINIIQTCFEREKEREREKDKKSPSQTTQGSQNTGSDLDTIQFLDMLLRLNVNEVLQDQGEQTTTADEKSNLFEEFHKSWDQNRIGIAIGIIKELENASPLARDNLFMSLDAFMNCIHEMTRQKSDAMFQVR